ncbi:hypothetical protein FACS1894187_25230 [Synergistales bacterium]|nr:hypothetical protein FACS1894187_25230 [Synergistales bacterium]
MKKFERFLDKAISLVSVVSYAGFFAIMILTVIDVFVRFVYNDPILGSYEIIERIVFYGVFASFRGVEGDAIKTVGAIYPRSPVFNSRSHVFNSRSPVFNSRSHVFNSRSHVSLKLGRIIKNRATEGGRPYIMGRC